MTDELSTPLGRAKKRTLPKLPVSAPQILAGVMGLFVVAVAAWMIFVDDPYGGEPVAVIATPVQSGGKTADAKTGGGQGASRYDGPPPGGPDVKAAAATPPAGSKTVTIIDGSSGKSQQVVIAGAPGEAGAQTAQKPAADQRLLEQTRHGNVPKVAADGMRPAVLYAQPAQASGDGPRIALIVGGLGISANGTAEALIKLPPAVTFAFAPYGPDVEKLAERARAEKHELLLQTPMEPFDYPDNDPGPQTLLTSLGPDQNVDRLHWLMSRFQGYVGIANYMGGRFTATEQALSPVLKETAKRGLIYVDDGTSGRSVAGQLAGGANLPFARAQVVIDAVPTSAEIDKALGRLEMLARENGTAVGMATALPATVTRIAEWVKRAQGRVVTLIPISAVANKPKSS